MFYSRGYKNMSSSNSQLAISQIAQVFFFFQINKTVSGCREILQYIDVQPTETDTVYSVQYATCLSLYWITIFVLHLICRVQDQIAFLYAVTACPTQLSAAADVLCLNHNSLLEKADIAESLSDTQGILQRLLKVAYCLKLMKRDYSDYIFTDQFI